MINSNSIDTQTTIAEDVLHINHLFISEVMAMKNKCPNWTSDPVHAVALLSERTGERIL